MSDDDTRALYPRRSPQRVRKNRMTALVAGAAVITLAGVGIATVLREPSGGSVSASNEPLAAPTTVAPADGSRGHRARVCTDG